MIIEAFGVVDHSPIEVSEGLKRLGMSHTIALGLRYQEMDIDGLCAEQPVWPIVVDYRNLNRVNARRSCNVLFVVGSRSALAETNIRRDLWRDEHSEPRGIEYDLKKALLSLDLTSTKPWEFERNAMSLSEFVNVASKPSFLSHIQTALCKINPYALRKEIQAAVIAYLDSRLTHSKLMTLLNKSLRFETLKALMADERTQVLRSAVTAYRANGNVEAVAKEYDIEPFEISYIAKSSDNTMATKTTKKR